MDGRELRGHVVEALRAAAVFDGLDEARQRAFVEEGVPFRLSELDMDSLARMEFCIAIELSLGISVLPAQLAELDSSEALQRFLAERIE